MNKKIKNIVIILLLLTIFSGIVYAASIARDRKSTYIPWQGTASGYYDNEHNVGESYDAEDRFTCIFGDCAQDTDGIIKDNVTGLEWQSNADDEERDVCETYDTDDFVDNQFYTGDNASECNEGDDSDDCNFCAAIVYCNNLELDGKTDWRLPNIKELQSIVDYSKKDPAIDNIFTTNNWTYYSSTEVEGRTWAIGFTYGYHMGVGHKSRDVFIRCVR